MDIDLDPASSHAAQKVVKAERYYTAEDDGLLQPWEGRIWLNPTYRQPLIQKFTQVLCEVFDSGKVIQAIVLTNNASETRWFQAIAHRSTAICFPKTRIKFFSPDLVKGRQPLQGQTIFYLSQHHWRATQFDYHFGQFGQVVVKKQRNGF
jgi:ParB family chromosome partitioning protein